uniref:Uncharacterized protein n=1 Tax=Anguilla anguilla TaxID=7936 RepID=A0A0E9XGK7_ANGAN
MSRSVLDCSYRGHWRAAFHILLLENMLYYSDNSAIECDSFKLIQAALL